MSTASLVAPAQGGLDGLSVGVLLCDGRGGVQALTAAGARLFDRGFTDDRGMALPDLSVLVRQVLRTQTAATLAVVAGQARFWLELYPVGTRVLALLRPVHADAVRDKGLFDPLTGLPNRVLLFDRLDQALRRARVRGTKTTFVLAELCQPSEQAVGDTGNKLVNGLAADHTVARYAGATFAVVVDQPAGSGVTVARRVVALAPHPVRTGWVTSDGTHSVHDVVAKAEEELQA
jgi:hypothetical protein